MPQYPVIIPIAALCLFTLQYHEVKPYAILRYRTLPDTLQLYTLPYLILFNYIPYDILQLYRTFRQT